MHLDLKEHVTRLIYFALNLLDEIRSAPNDVDAIECRASCLELLKPFEQADTEQETFHLAQYALAVWIDDLLCRAKWPHAGAWRAKPLEEELFGTTCRHWRFFEQAEVALRRQDWDALSVFQFCVEFGFRGIYAKDRVKVRLNDRLPMARARALAPEAVPLLAGVVHDEQMGYTASPVSLDSTSDHHRHFFSPPFTAEYTQTVLPPTLGEWSQRTFGPLGKRPSPISPPQFLLGQALGAKKFLTEWAIVMAVGFLLFAVLFAMGH